ncbi:MAG: rRNA maturation RNAse YbeY, partial [Burkholderiales bacterium]
MLAWERARGARVELTLLDGPAMRRLNRRATGRRRVTDVIAFALPQPDGTLVGDVYVCPDYAERYAARNGKREAA